MDDYPNRSIPNWMILWIGQIQIGWLYEKGNFKWPVSSQAVIALVTKHRLKLHLSGLLPPGRQNIFIRMVRVSVLECAYLGVVAVAAYLGPAVDKHRLKGSRLEPIWQRSAQNTLPSKTNTLLVFLCQDQKKTIWLASQYSIIKATIEGEFDP